MNTPRALLERRVRCVRGGPVLLALIVGLLLGFGNIGGCPASVDNRNTGASVAGGADDDGTSATTDGATADGGTTGDTAGTDGSGSDGTSDGWQAGGSDGQGTTDGDTNGADSGTGDTGGADGQTDGTNDGETGDDADTDGSGDAATSFQATGTYTGQLECTVSESLNGQQGNPTQQTRDLTITFDPNGLPETLYVPGYRDMEFAAPVNQVGDVVELTQTADEYEVTLTVTVAVASYSPTSARIVLNLAHFGRQDNLTEEGTGTQVIEMDLTDGTLSYTSLTSYEVEMRVETLRFDTTREYDCAGTLTPR